MVTSFPKQRTIHMQEEKATEEVTTIPKEHWKMCLFKAEIFSTKHYTANSLKTFGCPFARGEQRIYSPLPAGFRKVSQKWWCKTTAGRSQCVTSRISPALLGSWVRAGPCAPCTLRCVRYLRLHSSRTMPIHWVPPFLDLPASLRYKGWLHCSQHEFLHLRSQTNTQDI